LILSLATAGTPEKMDKSRSTLSKCAKLLRPQLSFLAYAYTCNKKEYTAMTMQPNHCWIAFTRGFSNAL